LVISRPPAMSTSSRKRAALDDSDDNEDAEDVVVIRPKQRKTTDFFDGMIAGAVRVTRGEASSEDELKQARAALKMICEEESAKKEVKVRSTDPFREYARCWQFGLGGEKNETTSLIWFVKSCAAGYEESYYDTYCMAEERLRSDPEDNLGVRAIRLLCSKNFKPAAWKTIEIECSNKELAAAESIYCRFFTNAPDHRRFADILHRAGYNSKAFTYLNKKGVAVTDEDKANLFYYRACSLELVKNFKKHMENPNVSQELKKKIGPIFSQKCVEEENVNEMFLCPILHNVMKTPVVAADGHTYERENLVEWLKTKNTSPLTGAKLAHKKHVPNYLIKSYSPVVI